MSQENIDAAVGQVNLMTDEDLNKFVDFIRGEMKDRANRRNRLAKASLSVGDRVIFAGNLKPQYLIGLMGTVEEIRQSRVTVKLDRGPTKKFRSGRVLANPSSLNKLNGDK